MNVIFELWKFTSDGMCRFELEQDFDIFVKKKRNNTLYVIDNYPKSDSDSESLIRNAKFNLE